MRNLRLVVLTLGLVAAVLVWSGARKNGFDVDNASIPTDEILSGGPPRDGIPAIDAPVFVDAAVASFLKPDSRVIGVAMHGTAKAYPIAILNWHEVVNDEIGGDGIVVTFCPLCGTGMVFKTPGATSLGVSGLLYNSDVLLYDRATESLWSQLKMEAVSGKRLGEKLTLLPASHTNWQDWRQRYPDTRVLSTDTGQQRDYSRNPYQQYGQQRDLYFPVSNQDRRYHPKEMVIAVDHAGKLKAWPFKELAQGDGEFRDRLGDEEVTVIYDAEARTGAYPQYPGGRDSQCPGLLVCLDGLSPGQ